VDEAHGAHPTQAGGSLDLSDDRALGERMTSGDGQERFALGLDVIVKGLPATPTEGRLTASPRSD
jgi:hypothetical protein